MPGLEDSARQKGLCLLARTSKQICKHEEKYASGGLKIVLIAGIFWPYFYIRLSTSTPLLKTAMGGKQQKQQVRSEKCLVLH